MSRAFVNEERFEQPGDVFPDRPISEHPNYVTPEGAAHLAKQVEILQALKEKYATESKNGDLTATERLAETERDLRYYETRLESSILVDPKSQPKDIVLFGAVVTVEDEEGQSHTYRIVGEDEADVQQNKVSYISPIAHALIGRKLGDSVTWRRPAGDLILEIQKIEY
ncbi:MAG TPA: GreA/GreB family elongation factor [Methylophilus sp.]|nr:GreA/GreB family elongation factor [Methylophilus sp.]HQQ32616.1 GreA/GreB family elongation factor [Methylophilus sp.]